jgi:hypothetical protein
MGTYSLVWLFYAYLWQAFDYTLRYCLPLILYSSNVRCWRPCSLAPRLLPPAMKTQYSSRSCLSFEVRVYGYHVVGGLLGPYAHHDHLRSSPRISSIRTHCRSNIKVVRKCDHIKHVDAFEKLPRTQLIN